MDELSGGGWIENTGKIPVSYDVLVDVRWSNSEEEYNYCRTAGTWAWQNDLALHITHWRLHFPETVSENHSKISDKALPVKSDGGSSDYYKLTVTNKDGDTLECELGDIIRCVFGDNFSIGNIVKACRRVYLKMSGNGGKDGVSVEYDCKKIKWFADEVAFWNKAK